MEETFECCICGNLTHGYGNNPDGAVWKNEDGAVVMPEFKAEDRCCDLCDSRYVIPGRLYRMALLKKQASEN